MSLQKLCLNTIINHFKYYNTLFRSAEDVSTKRHFEFLQRKYSFEIASGLHAKNDLREEYIDLTVNKYLKVLTTEWFGDCSWDTIYSKFEEIGPTLLKVHFHHLPEVEMNESFDDGIPWVDVICHLPNLQILYFEGNCQNKVFESLAKYCENIAEIEIRGYIENDWINALSVKDGKVPFSKLKRFFLYNYSLSEDKISEDDMKYLLKNLPSLEITNCYDLPKVLYKLHEDDFSALDKVEPYKLISLNFLRGKPFIFFEEDKYKYYNDFLRLCLSVCPHLKALRCYSLNEESLELISNVNQLEKLHLENYSNSALDVSNVLKLKGSQLTSLTIWNHIVPISVLAKNSTQLKKLNTNRICFVVDDNDSKLLFPCLYSCTFINPRDDPATDRAMGLLLSSSPKLKSIAFRFCSLLSPEIKTQFLKCCENFSIKFINIRRCEVEMSFLRDIILNCHSLKRINIGSCNLGAENEQELYWLAKGRPNNPNVFFRSDLRSDFKTFEEELEDNSEDESDDDDFISETNEVHLTDSEDYLTDSEDYMSQLEEEDGDDNWMTESEDDDDFMIESDDSWVTVSEDVYFMNEDDEDESEDEDYVMKPEDSDN